MEGKKIKKKNRVAIYFILFDWRKKKEIEEKIFCRDKNLNFSFFSIQIWKFSFLFHFISFREVKSSPLRKKKIEQVTSQLCKIINHAAQDKPYQLKSFYNSSALLFGEGPKAKKLSLCEIFYQLVACPATSTGDMLVSLKELARSPRQQVSRPCHWRHTPHSPLQMAE